MSGLLTLTRLFPSNILTDTISLCVSSEDKDIMFKELIGVALPVFSLTDVRQGPTEEEEEVEEEEEEEGEEEEKEEEKEEEEEGWKGGRR